MQLPTKLNTSHVALMLRGIHLCQVHSPAVAAGIRLKAGCAQAPAQPSYSSGYSQVTAPGQWEALSVRPYAPSMLCTCSSPTMTNPAYQIPSCSISISICRLPECAEGPSGAVVEGHPPGKCQSAA